MIYRVGQDARKSCNEGIHTQNHCFCLVSLRLLTGPLCISSNYTVVKEQREESAETRTELMMHREHFRISSFLTYLYNCNLHFEVPHFNNWLPNNNRG